MNEIVGAALLAQQAQHTPPVAHVVLLAGVVVVGLVVFAIARWRSRRDAAAHGDSALPPGEEQRRGEHR